MPNNNKHSGPSVTPGRNVYRGVRDPIVLNAGAATLTATPLNGKADIGNTYILSPMGLISVSVASGSAPAAATISLPTLPFLYRTASNFQQYRVTRAVLVFVSNFSSTATGRVTLSGSVDFADAAPASSQLGLVNAKQFDLAGIANKEARYQLPVDSSWKKVSAMLTIASGNSLVPINTVNDLAFSSAQLFITGFPPQDVNIGTVYVEYDVEFKGPVSTLINS